MGCLFSEVAMRGGGGGETTWNCWKTGQAVSGSWESPEDPAPVRLKHMDVEIKR